MERQVIENGPGEICTWGQFTIVENGSYVTEEKTPLDKWNPSPLQHTHIHTHTHTGVHFLSQDPITSSVFHTTHAWYKKR